MSIYPIRFEQAYFRNNGSLDFPPKWVSNFEEYGAAVTSLDLSHMPFEEEKQQPRWVKKITTLCPQWIIKTFPNLTSLTLRDSNIGHFELVTLMSLEKLEEFSLKPSYCNERLKTLKPIFDHTRLQKLTLSNCKHLWKFEENTTPCISLKELKVTLKSSSFEVSEIRRFHSVEILTIKSDVKFSLKTIVTKLQSLKHLTLNGFIPPTVLNELSTATSLVSLKVEHTHFLENIVGNPFSREPVSNPLMTLSVLSGLPNLKETSLKICMTRIDSEQAFKEMYQAIDDLAKLDHVKEIHYESQKLFNEYCNGCFVHLVEVLGQKLMSIKVHHLSFFSEQIIKALNSKKTPCRHLSILALDDGFFKIVKPKPGQLFTIFNAFPSLKELEIRFLHIEALNLENLEKLHCINSSLAPSLLDSLLKPLPNLISLALSDRKDKLKNVEVALILPHLPNLTALDLSESEIGDTTIDKILTYQKNLLYFNAENSDITPKGTQKFNDHPTLRALNLHHHALENYCNAKMPSYALNNSSKARKITN